MSDAMVGALKSKTMWFNWLVAALPVLDWLQAHAGLLQAVLPPQVTPWFVVIGAVGTVLRAVTSTSLPEKVQ